MDDLPPEEVWSAVDRTVAELLSEAGVAGPPVDAVAVARHLGIPVAASRESASRAGPGVGKPIVLDADEREEQRQWTAARAVGERCRPEVIRRLGLEPAAARAMSGASLANLIATRLLTPTRWLAREAGRCGWELPDLKERFRTAGWELLAFRLADLPEPCVVTVVDDGRVYRRRSNGPRVNRTLTPAERECYEATAESGRAASLRRDNWLVAGWVVPALSCSQRVVLRAVLDETD